MSRFLQFAGSDKYQTLCLLLCYVVIISPLNPQGLCFVMTYDVQHEGDIHNSQFVFVPSWTMQLVSFLQNVRCCVEAVQHFLQEHVGSTRRLVSIVMLRLSTGPSNESNEGAAGTNLSRDNVSFPECSPMLASSISIRSKHHWWYGCHWMTNQ
jgi:hypothetical protein